MNGLETHYPKESWTHVYTDDSAENAVRNGGAGVYIQYSGGKEYKISLATGLYSTNHKADAKALKTDHIEVSTHVSPNVVLLTDVLSVLQALQIGTLNTSLLLLPRFVEAMQTPCSGFPPTATCLAMRLLTLWQRKAQQRSKSSCYPEVKTILKAQQHSKWRHEHPRYNKADSMWQRVHLPEQIFP